VIANPVTVAFLDTCPVWCWIIYWGVREGEVFEVDGKLPAILHTRYMDGKAVPRGEVSEVM
jgi:hypothetical protein